MSISLKQKLAKIFIARKNTKQTHRVLVAGWFSFTDRKATFGDLEAKNIVCEWLADNNIPYDVAGTANNRVDGVDIWKINPQTYTILIFVCGPWHVNKPLLERFQHCLKIGIDLSVQTDDSAGFDYLLPRDSPTTSTPDIVFASKTSHVPVAGIILVHPQPMYGDRQRHSIVHKVIIDFVNTGEIAPIYIDTELDENKGGLINTSQFESVIRRTDFVISTRLHGMVFAIKNDVPVIAVDPVAGGAKITAQAKALGWPLLIGGEYITEGKLNRYVDRCLDGSLSNQLIQCRANAEEAILRTKGKLLEILQQT